MLREIVCKLNYEAIFINANTTSHTQRSLAALELFQYFFMLHNCRMIMRNLWTKCDPLAASVKLLFSIMIEVYVSY